MAGRLTAAERVAEFGRSYLDRARAELGARVEAAEAIVATRRPLGDGRVALAGWWCEPEGPEELVVLPNPWDDRAAIGAHAEHALALVRSLAADVGAALDHIHDRPPHGPVYWDVLLGPWLVHVVCAALDRRLFCRAAAGLRGDLAVVHTRRLSPGPAMADIFDRLVRSDAGNAALVGTLAAHAGLTTVEDAPAAASGGSSPPARNLRGALLAGARLADALAWRAGSWGRGRQVALLAQGQMGTADALRLVRRVRGARLAPAPRETAASMGLGQVDVDDAVRERLAESLEGEELGGLIAAALPRSLVEDRVRLEHESRARYGEPCAVAIGNYRTDEVEGHFCGLCAEQGHPIAFVQHGGAYLQAAVNLQQALELRPWAVFMSWGGRGEGVRPLASPRLERVRNTHRGGDRVVIIEHMHPPDAYAIRFASTPMGNQSHRQMRMLAEFVEAIGPAHRHHLFLKRFPHASDDDRRSPALATLAHRDPRPWRRSAKALMANARMTVLTYPDTPLIEAMALGVPTMGLWDPALWELRDDAAGPFAALAEAGVLYSDPQAAAAHLDRVYDHAAEWWFSTEVQAARGAFVERFARQGDWLAEWSEFLSRLARPGREAGPR